ncbi:TonB-dependent receptor family protein [Enhygromyxa salina]|uniref:Fe(3+) dicitrate transport protein FecA n=1 Tax=Enhygromyxa salina TaxID=215803 RepID=A0A2S9XTF6_9BACT|nr:TonB-dependent receptor [Enhygromyxa salina]PRP96157.1 Fe(3+) dicitrate transport protein FecA precursor [Enhygromyxa salina]
MLVSILWLGLAGPPAEPPTPDDDVQTERERGEFAPVEITAPPEREREPEPEPEPKPEPEPEPEPPLEQVPVDDDIPLDEDLEEDLESDEDVREIIVDASALGNANALDVFNHAGGRVVVDKQEMVERGATNVGEALDRKPGVRTVEGNSGLGSQDTKLQVAVRGVNPRLSARATVLLDEIPIAPAPYGQPQLSLFPISLFSIADIDVVRGGATARYGPQTSGGVFNLISNPIPEHPRIAVFTQGDSNRDFSLGGAYGATHGRFGMYLEYAPRVGRSWREHSDKLVHGGLAKFAWQFNPKVRLESISHGYFEDSELPGGLSRAAYNEDPFQSRRPFDEFRGMRFGTALKLSAQLGERQDLKISTWYNRSYRSTTIANTPGDTRSLIEEIVIRPRTYDVMGIEPRWTMRFDADKHDFSHQLSIGARAAYEIASMQTFTARPDDSLLVDDNDTCRLNADGQLAAGDKCTSDDDARTGAYAGYVNEKLIFLGGDLAIDVGVRLEFIRLSRRANLEEFVVDRRYWAPLPAASVWYAPIDEFALFAAYGRSFGPPQYLQVIVVGVDDQLVPETSNSVELGVKALELGGVYGEVTGWYKEFTNFIDVGEESFDNIRKIHIWGIESELSWYPGEVWDSLDDIEYYVGYGWTDSYVLGLTYTGNKMPWYPEHELWAGASYGFDFGLKFGADLSYYGKQYTDYENREQEDQDTAAYGPIPDYATINVWASMQTPLATSWQLEFTTGIKNIGDARYFSRTDDRNAGILVGRPRTFYFNVGFAHDFLPKHMRANRRKRAADKRAAGRSGHGNQQYSVLDGSQGRPSWRL